MQALVLLESRMINLMLAHRRLDIVPRGGHSQILVHTNNAVPVALLDVAGGELNNRRHPVLVESQSTLPGLDLVEGGAAERLVLAIVHGRERHEHAVAARAQNIQPGLVVEANASRWQAVAVALTQEASRAVAHVKDPHLDRVVARRGHHQRLELQRLHAVHCAAVGLANLRNQTLLL